ncbi:MAG TPA: SpoIIE family protein phosphatase [Vicinamibacterales bacterium]|nr:SpoIIE family protein phosphatase [Vicinamibacterales bacterium]
MTAIRLLIEPPGGQPSERECRTGAVTFGRGADSDIVIADHSMSRHHARIAAEEGHWIVEDLGARNGTFVNGERIDGRQPIVPGDVVKMGGTLVRVSGTGTDRIGALGVGELGSSIFRPIAELTQEVETPTGAPSRVAARLKALNDFHRAMAGPIALDALLELLLERLFSALHPEEGVILLRQPDGTLATAASRRLQGATGELVVSRRLVSEVVDKGTAALVSDIAVDERFAGAHSIIGSGIRSILAAPISDAAGCVGMVAIYSRAHVRRFGEEDMELLVSLASAASLRIRNVALAEEAAARRVQDHELALAHDIQMAMLPRHTAERPELDMAAALIPARAVGGDLYDFLIIDDRLWFIVADAAGKGVSAALFMAVTRTLFRAVAHSEATVASVVTRMNTELARDNERQFFVTAVVGRLDLRSGELAYASAGHPPPLRASGGAPPRPLDAIEGGVALGIVEDATYEEGRLALVAGDLLLMFTDGVTEAINSRRELFSEARLYASLAGPDRPVLEIVATLIDDVNAFAAGQPQEDDITVLALRYRGPAITR